MKDIFLLMKKHKILFISYLLFGALSQSLPGLLFPYVQKLFIDSFLNKKDFNNFYNILVIVIGYGIATIIFSKVYILVSGKLQGKIINDLRYSLYEKLIESDWNDITKRGNGEIISTIINDPLSVVNILEPFKEIIMCSFIILGSIALAYSIDSKTIYIIPIIIVIVCIYYLFNTLISKESLNTSTKYQEDLGVLTGKINEDVNGLREVQFYNKSESQKYSFNKYINMIFNSYTRIYKVFSKSTILWNGFNTVINCAIFIFVFKIFWKTPENTGSVVATIQYLIQIASLSIGIGVYWIHINTGLGALKKINTFIESTNKIQEDFIVNDFEEYIPNAISIENISYSIDKKQIIKNISIKISNFEQLGITGLSGVGKTTFFNLILGALFADEGRILLFNKDITKCGINYRKKIITPIFQEVFIFTGTVYDNISLLDNYPQDDIISLAEKIGVIDFINNLPNGLFTKINEKGVNLSGGERQKIGFLRALMRNPKIFLVDEGTSWMDTQSEQHIMEYLKENRITLIFVSHKASLLNKMDNIMVMGEKGSIIEYGAPKELLKKRGKYYSLQKLNLI